VEAVRELDVDVVYGLLNWRAVPLAARVLRELPHLPFVWHFKEAPQACVRRGTWPDLAALCEGADEVLLATEEERAWLDLALPGRLDPGRTACSTATSRSPSGSPASGRRGCPSRTAPSTRRARAPARRRRRPARAPRPRRRPRPPARPGPRPRPAAGWAAAVREAQAQVDTVHVHPKVEQPDWVRVLSRYDAGWLHRFRSRNGGDLRRAVWDDLNAPARIPTYASAGLPMLQQASPGSVVAAERCSATARCSTTTSTTSSPGCTTVPAGPGGPASWDGRLRFTFDAHVDRLVAVLERAAGSAGRGAGRRAGCASCS
jgi:hypothetical protein